MRVVCGKYARVFWLQLSSLLGLKDKGEEKMVREFLWRKPPHRDLKLVVVHCSATPPSADIGVAEIRVWHTRDRGWQDIGYNFAIRRNGTIEGGRDLDNDGDYFEEIGAHVAGKNSISIGICMIGGVKQGNPNIAEDNFTDAQWKALRQLLRVCRADYPKATIHGHNEFANKACPSFDVQHELREGRLQGI